MTDRISGDTRARSTGQITGGGGVDEAKKADNTPTLDELTARKGDGPAASFVGGAGPSLLPGNASVASTRTQAPGGTAPASAADMGRDATLHAGKSGSARLFAHSVDATALAVDMEPVHADAAGAVNQAADDLSGGARALGQGNLAQAITSMQGGICRLDEAKDAVASSSAALAQRAQDLRQDVAETHDGVLHDVYRALVEVQEKRLAQMKPGDTSQLELQASAGQGIQADGGAKIGFEKTEDGRYRTTFEVSAQVAVGAGIKGSGDALEAKAGVSAKVGVEMIADTPEEAVAQAAKLAALASSPAGVAALAATGNLDELGSKVTRVSFSGGAGAELAAKLQLSGARDGAKGTFIGGGASGSAALESTFSVVLDQGRVTGLEVTQTVQGTSDARVGLSLDVERDGAGRAGYGRGMQAMRGSLTAEIKRIYEPKAGEGLTLSDVLGAGGGFYTGGIVDGSPSKVELHLEGVAETPVGNRKLDATATYTGPDAADLVTQNAFYLVGAGDKPARELSFSASVAAYEVDTWAAGGTLGLFSGQLSTRHTRGGGEPKRAQWSTSELASASF